MSRSADPRADIAPERGAVTLQAVTKRYGDHTAVDALSLDIQPGEFLSLLGPSGCGKTTTLRMIAGFEHPDEGDIQISGRSVLGTPAYRRDVNTVFQAYALFPHLTVAENVAYGLQQKRVPKLELRERVAAALEMVQMRGFADRKPTQLSGGQQQRVALAQGIKAEGEARGAAIAAEGLAEAQAIDAKAEALKKYGEAALAQEIIGRLPEITRAVAEPLAAIGNLTVVSTDGASAVTKTVGQVASEVPAVVKNLTGLDLTALLSGVAGGALADAAKPAAKRAPKATPPAE
jgi:ABC-type arginine transport system ATPase subunit